MLTGIVTDVLLIDVLPQSLGLETRGGVFTKLLERNTPIPTRRTDTFTTAEDNQASVLISLFQGEGSMIADNTPLGTVQLSNLPAAPANVPQIEVTFDIDADGVLGVTATDRGTGLATSATVTPATGLTPDVLERLRREFAADLSREPTAAPRPAADDVAAPAAARNPATSATPPAETQGVFISYRRSDSGHVAGRLFDRLVARLGEGSVFMDVDSIEPGLDFRDVIDEAIGRSAVLLVLIGAHWIDATDASGRRRLDNADDVVRLEVGNALGRGIRVIPVVVDDATMPDVSELPEEITSLGRRNATRLRHESFRSDMEQLVAVVDRVLDRG